MSIDSITAENLEQWALDMRARNYRSTSIRRKFATVRVFFKYWVRKGGIGASPMWRIRLDIGRERVLPRCLSATDAKQLIEAAWIRIERSCESPSGPGDRRLLECRNLAAIEILFATGMRIGELVSLNIADWRDEDASFVVQGKGRRQRLAFLPDDRSLKAVRMYYSWRLVIGRGEEALFLNAAGRRISTQGLSKVVTHTAEVARISTRVTPHMLRHTVATLLLRFGADIRVVQEVLGHASIATTQRYTHMSKEHMVSTLRARHPNHHLDINLGCERQAS